MLFVMDHAKASRTIVPSQPRPVELG